VDEVITWIPLLGSDRRVEIFRYGVNLAGCQIHDERLRIVAVGYLPFVDIQSDAVKCFGSAVNQQFFTIGRKLCRIGVGLIFPYGVNGHGGKIEHVEATLSEWPL